MSSDLPQITNEQILQRVLIADSEEISKLKNQVAHLGLLAEALRDERNTARQELAELRAEKDSQVPFENTEK